MASLSHATAAILAARRAVSPAHAVLAAISGIDGSGKGWVAARLAGELEAAGLRVAVVGVDGWLNLPAVRFDPSDPAGTFYRRAIRFDELFDHLLLPLRDLRSLGLEADYTEETADRYRRHVYAYRDVDVILVEGIFLLKRELRRHYDVTVWIDCSFDTALERAIARAQEGLPPDETVRAYRAVYFPAQEMHFVRDQPRESASVVVVNDDRAVGGPTAGARIGGV